MELINHQTLNDASAERHRPMPRWLMVALAISSIFYVIVNLHISVGILGNAALDDALFYNHALSILEGHWLGPYSQLTLAKGPGYPLFLAASSLSGLPITLTQSLLYIVASLLISSTVFRLCGRPIVTLAVFLIVEWQPYIMPTRIIRDDICAAQTLLILGCFTRALLFEKRQHLRLAWATSGGMLAGWFWMTREDGIWLVPGLGVMIALYLLRGQQIRRSLSRTAAPTLAFGGSALVTLGIVAGLNLAIYGTFTVVDFKSSSFTNALDALQSVRVGPPVAFVPVPGKVRHAIGRVSPAFARLEPYFNGPDGRGWKQPGCALYPATCNDIAGGWFMWALRGAVASQGYYSSAARSAAFYRKITEQIKTACSEGTLTCRGSIIPFMPATTPAQWRRVWPDIVEIARLATMQFPLWPEIASSGSIAQINRAMLLLHNPLRTKTITESAAVWPNGGHTGRSIFSAVHGFYSFFMPTVAAAAILVYIIDLVRIIIKFRVENITPLFILASSVWTLVVARATILILVDISSFPVINAQYFTAGLSLFCLGVVISLSLLGEMVNLVGVRRSMSNFAGRRSPRRTVE